MAIPVRNSRIKLSQGQIFWREVGTGTVVIFLHGSWSDSSQWLPIMEHLSEHYHCFAPDLLGFGDSERPKIHYSIALEAECLAEFLDKLLPQKQVYLVGDSLGGWIAVSYVLKYLERVTGVVLLAPEGLSVRGTTAVGWWTRWLLGHPYLASSSLRSLKSLGRLLRQEDFVKRLFVRWHQMLQHPTTCRLFFRRRQAEIQAELLQERLEALNLPILILQREQDTPEAIAQSKAYADLLPQCDYQTVDGSADLIAELIREFTQRQ